MARVLLLLDALVVRGTPLELHRMLEARTGLALGALLAPITPHWRAYVAAQLAIAIDAGQALAELLVLARPLATPASVRAQTFNRALVSQYFWRMLRV